MLANLIVEVVPGSAGGERGIGGNVENNVDPLVWHGCDSREGSGRDEEGQ